MLGPVDNDVCLDNAPQIWTATLALENVPLLDLRERFLARADKSSPW